MPKTKVPVRKVYSLHPRSGWITTACIANTLSMNSLLEGLVSTCTRRNPGDPHLPWQSGQTTLNNKNAAGSQISHY